jgi:AraC family transcriptional regulator of adaptative response/methylated-DNA-[protein]-cysteine methyltransferase
MNERKTQAAATLADPRWAAVAARDARFDGRFFYSVRTTGVYCRPSCASRTARPEHVAFHPSAQAAERAGFRPCRRCKPDQAPLAERHAATVARLCRYIDAAEHVPSLLELAREATMSPHHLHRTFRALTGLTPAAYAAAARAKRMRRALEQCSSVTDAIYQAGFNSSGRFYETSARELGMTPTRYRGGGQGAAIEFALSSSSLGTVLAARSERGICAISLGNDGEALVQELHRRFPNARIAPAGPEFLHTMEAVVRLVEAPARAPDLPLDIRGSAFQQRVWAALRAIPAGSTVSYTELARRVGAPRAVRAVAGACAANALAVAVPCHRVLRSDGAISGYRWGVERKRALLEREAGSADPAAAASTQPIRRRARS